MLESVEALIAEHAELERSLADPAVIGDPDRLRTVNRRYAELTPVVTAQHELDLATGDLEAARELAAEDAAFAVEVPALEETVTALEDRLRRLLVPRDPDDDRDVILEIKAGEGGEESALFAGDLLRMYLRHAEKRGWKTQILDSTDSDLGGYKDVRVAISAKGAVEPGSAPWARLKYEGGVHRVQRVPVTESQGRIHTSAAGVWVMPEVEEATDTDLLHPNDLKIDVYRSSGPGGQSVNTTDSAVRITHLPTGTVVSCQNEKSQLQNKESAMRVLRARLHQMAMDEAAAEAKEARASQVRTVDRSERIRTYNFPENRISDHRTGFKANRLDAVLDGDLDAVVDSAVQADEDAQLAALAGDGGVTLRGEVDLAVASLAEAGVPSPRTDALLLAAHALGCDRGEVERRLLMGWEPDEGFLQRFGGLVEERATRLPLQHLTGTAPFRRLELHVGPGVFVPRPETEQAVDHVLAALVGLDAPLVVDLCTGSGALALAVADEAPTASVTAVEVSDLALAWAARNIESTGLPVELVAADATADPVGVPRLADVVGRVDVVVSNPPYIPTGMVPLEPEVAEHDPDIALYGGSEDGLAIPLAVAAAAARLLRPGGLLVMEHADSQGRSLPRALAATGAWLDAVDHADLAGRPRTTTARRA